MREEIIDPCLNVSIGYLVYQAINEEQTARVIGSTSRGIFLLTPKKRVIFISNHPYRSPLTITLQEPALYYDIVKPGMPVDISPGGIEIPEARLFIKLPCREPWFPPNPVELTTRPHNFKIRLEEIILQILATREEQGLSFLLLPLLKHTSPDDLTPNQSNILSRVQRLGKTFEMNDPIETLGILKYLFGLGRGLTPSGDDFIMGMLLALNRWPTTCWTVSFLPQLNQLVIQSAYLSTTAISANLIECAALCHSDERLLAAIDGLITGNISIQECVDNFTGLGASSGIDALAGMLVAFDL